MTTCSHYYFFFGLNLEQMKTGSVFQETMNLGMNKKMNKVMMIIIREKKVLEGLYLLNHFSGVLESR